MSSIFNFLARIPSLMTCFILRNFSLSDNEEGVCTVVVLVVTTCAAGRDKNCTCLRSPAISFFISRISSCAAGADNDCTCLRSSAMSSLISRTSSRSTSIGVRCVVCESIDCCVCVLMCRSWCIARGHRARVNRLLCVCADVSHLVRSARPQGTSQ